VEFLSEEGTKGGPGSRVRKLHAGGEKIGVYAWGKGYYPKDKGQKKKLVVKREKKGEGLWLFPGK